MATRLLGTIALQAASVAPGGFLSLDMNNQIIPNLADAVNPQDAVNLQTLQNYTPFDQVIHLTRTLAAGDLDTVIGNASLGLYLGWQSLPYPQLFVASKNSTSNLRVNFSGNSVTEDGSLRTTIGQIDILPSTPFDVYYYFNENFSSNELTLYNSLQVGGDTQNVSATFRTDNVLDPIFKITASAQIFNDIRNLDAISVQIVATLKVL